MANTHSHDGGPALPVQSAGHTIKDGMTQRDIYAAVAMEALIVAAGGIDSVIARDAYDMADMMLAERAKGGAA